MRLADWLLSAIADAGVRHVFFLPGGGAMHLNDALAGEPRLEAVSMLHEQGASIAAEAYARVTGGLGVCMVTSGPGATNAITGLAGAWLDSTPVLFLSGQVKRADLKGESGLRMLGVQEVDTVALVRPLTKYAVTVLEPHRIRWHLERAVHAARSGRTGPVWLDIPLDVQAAQIDPASLDGFTPDAEPEDDGFLRDAVGETLRLLCASKRPLLLLGNGVRLAQATEECARAIELLRAPVATTWLGLDLIPDDHPLCAGRPGSIAPRSANFALQNADFLLSIGARLDMAMTAYAHDRLARGAEKVLVDIDGAELAKMRTPIRLPVQADARRFLSELLRQLQGKPLPERGEWTARIREWRARYPLVTAQHRDASAGLSMYLFSEILSDLLEPGEVVAPGSSGFACEIFLLVIKPKRGQRIYHNRGTGAMGFGLPSAIGACMAAGGRRVVSVDGEGGFLMNIQELAVAAARRLPIKWFVINNDGYASIRASQQNYFGRQLGADRRSGLVLPSVAAVARAYGIDGVMLDPAGDVAAQVQGVLQSTGPVVCEVPVRPDEAREPRVASRARPDGSMVSTPLEDLWPFLPREELAANMYVPLLEESR